MTRHGHETPTPKFVCRECGNNTHAIKGTPRELEGLCPNCFDYQCHYCGKRGLVRVRNKNRHLNLCVGCDKAHAESAIEIVCDPVRYAQFLETSYHARTYKNYRRGL